MRLRKPRLRSYCTGIALRCLVPAQLILQDHAPVIPRLRVVGLDGNGLTETDHGLFIALQGLQSQAQIEIGLGVARVVVYRNADAFHRQSMLARLHGHGTEHV